MTAALAVRIRQWLRWGVACCTLAAAPPLARAEAPSIVVFGLHGSLSSQIEAELSSLGFHVLTGAANASAETPRELQAAARKAGAAAAVSVRPSERGVEVWLVDRVTGKTLSREVVQLEPALDRERVIAVRVVELLRASLLELQLPSGAEGEVRATPQLQALAGLPSPRLAQEREQSSPARPAAQGYGALQLHAGLGFASSVGATRVTPLVALAAFWQPMRPLSIGISGFLPLASAEVSDREGSVRIATWQLNVGTRLYPFAATGAFWPVLDLGGVTAAVSGRCNTGSGPAGGLLGSELLVRRRGCSRRAWIRIGSCAARRPLRGAQWRTRGSANAGHPLRAGTRRECRRACAAADRIH